jgi:hydrogenase nickel insertion protein HypA
LHEYVYADRILQSVLDLMRESDKGKVSEVRVEVGELLGLTGPSLKEAYGYLSKGTRADGSKLTVHFAPSSVKCDGCGYSGRPEGRGRHAHVIDPALLCPRCSAPLSIDKGMELEIEGVS